MLTIYIQYLYIILIIIYLSIFSFIYNVSNREIELLLFASSFMLIWSNWLINKHIGNLQCDFFIFIRNHYIRLCLIFSMEHLRKITSSSYLTCLKIMLKNNQYSGRGDPLPLQKFQLKQTIAFYNNISWHVCFMPTFHSNFWHYSA